MPKKAKKQAIVQDPNLFWMIRRKVDGLYTDGKIRPYWSANGKTWHSHSRLLSHIRQIDRNLEWYRKHGNKWEHPYKGCEIVQFRRTEEAKSDFESYGE